MLRNSLHFVIFLSVLVACGPSDNSGTSGSGSLGAGANNAPPNPGDPISETIQEDATPLTVDLAENATDVEGDALTYAITSIEPIDADVVVDLASGILIYSPTENFNGHVTVVYEVADEFKSSLNTVDVEVTAVNDVPTAPDFDVVIAEDAGMQLIDLLAVSSDIDGDVITLDEITIGALNGTVTLSSEVLTSVEYTSNPNFFGTDSFEYQISDATGATSTGLVTIEIGSQNDAPVAYPAEEYIDEDSIGQTLDLANFITHADPVNLVYSINANSFNAVVNGSIVTFSPDLNFNGDAMFTYTVSDQDPIPDTASNSVTFHVAPVNDDPIANNGPIVLDEDTVDSINLAHLIYDVDGDDLLISILGLPDNGDLVNIGGTLYEFTPPLNYYGTDSFTYAIDDGNGGSDEGTITITVNPVNDAPIANDVPMVIEEDIVSFIDLADFISDIDGDDLSISISVETSNGTLVNSDGTVYEFTPNPDYHGADSFTYAIDDGNGGSDDGTVTITVNSVNDVPTGDDVDLIVQEDVTFGGDLSALANIDDIEGDTLIYTFPATSVAGGQIQQNGSNFDYTSKENYNSDLDGDDSFTATVDDQNGGVISIIVDIVVTAVNDDPIANDGPMALDEDTVSSIDLAALISEVDGDDVSINISAETSNGILENIGGTVYQFTPALNYYGPDSFTYAIDDGNGGNAEGTVTITVNSINDVPTGDDVDLVVLEDTPFGGNLSGLANIDDIEGDTLIYTFPATSVGGGQIQQNGSTFQYTPLGNYNSYLDGDDSFIATVDDQNGGVIAITVNIVVNAVNDYPIANNGSMELDEDIVSSIDLANLISDVDGDSLSINIAAGASNGSLVHSGGTVYEFTPTLNYYGPDSFTYAIDDGNGGNAEGTVTITVNSINDVPTGNDIDIIAVEDALLLANLATLANIDDVEGDTLLYTFPAFSAGGGQITIIYPVNETNPHFRYTSRENYNSDLDGDDSFIATVDDQNGGVIAITVNIVVTPVDDPLGTQDILVSTHLEDTTDEYQVITLAVTDNFDEDEITIGSHADFSTAGGIVTQSSPGVLRYTPPADWNSVENGLDVVTFTLNDGTQDYSQVIEFDVIDVNDAPVASNGSETATEDALETIAIVDSYVTDVDPASTTTFTIESAVATSGATVTIDPSGQFITYLAPLNYNSDLDGDDLVTYTVIDNSGELNNFDSGEISVSVTPVNDAPTVAANFTLAAIEDVEFSPIDVFSLSFVEDVDDPNNDHSSLTVSVEDIGDGSATVLVIGDGTVSYLSSPNGPVDDLTGEPDGNGTETIAFRITDTDGLSVVVDMVVSHTAVNDNPIADNGPMTLDEDTASSIDLAALISDVDGDDLSISIAAGANNGSVVNVSGTVYEFTPNLDYNGTDSFTYAIDDGNGGNAEGTVTITVNPVNDAPIANNGPMTLDEDAVSSIDLAALISDVDGDDLSISISADTSNGTLVNVGGTVYEFTPNLDYNGTDSFTYAIDDGNGGNAEGTVTITVNPVNDAPIANNGPMTLDEDTASSIDLAALISDVDGDDLSISIAAGANNGSVVNVSGTVYEFTPNLNYNGTDSFTYAIDDGNGGNAQGTVTITVNPVNDAPTASSGTDSCDEDTSTSVDVVALGSDVDINDSLSLIGVSSPTANNGTVTMNGDLAVYTPSPDYYGTDSYTFTLEDVGGLTVTESISVTVNPIDDAPVAINDFFKVIENTQNAPLDVLLNDTDADGDSLIVSAFDDSQVTNGSLTLNAGLLLFTPDEDYIGLAGSFSYTVSDGAYSDTATATIVVIEENAFADSLAYELNGVTTQPQGFYSQVTENGSAFLLNVPGYDPLLTNVNGQGDVLFSATVNAALPGPSYALTNAVLSTATNNTVMLAMDFDNGSFIISTCMSFDATGSLLWSKTVDMSPGGHAVSAVVGLPTGGALLAVYSDLADATVMVVLGSNGLEDDEVTYNFGSHIINAIVPYTNNYYMALSDSGILVIEDDGHPLFHYGGAVGSSINIASARLTADGILMSGSDQSGSSLGAYSSLYDPALVMNPVLWSNTLADPLGQLDIEHNDLVIDTAGYFVAAGSINNIAGGTVVPTLHRIHSVGVSVSLSSFAAFIDGRFEGLIPNQSAANVVGSYSSGANFNFFTMSFDAADAVVSSCSTFGSEANQNFVSTSDTDQVMNLLKTNNVNDISTNNVIISPNSAIITLQNALVDRESLCL